MTTKAFLENGADIHARYPITIEVSESLQCLAKSRPVWFTKMRLHHEVSPSYTIRRRLEYTPELKELEEIFLAKGDRSSMKLSLVALGTDRYPWIRIPSREHDKLVAASNAASSAACHGCENTSFVPDYCKWARELRRFYEEREKDGDSDSRILLDESYPLSTDEEE